MTQARTGTKPHTGYRHEGLIYDGIDDFLAGTVPFVLDGLAAGQPVMAALTGPRLERLRAALGDRADDVRLVDMARIGHNPARIIEAWREFIADEGADGRALRGIGEPVWRGRRAVEVTECQLHESLLNLAIDPDTPLWLRCPYDRAALDPAVIDEVGFSHPLIVEADEYRGSTSYGGAHHASLLFTEKLPAPPDDAQTVAFAAGSIAGAAELVRRSARAAGIGDPRATELAAAADEVAGTSARHGGGTLSVWSRPDRLVFDVRDPDHITDALVGRTPPPTEDDRGYALWRVNRVADLTQIRSSPAGTTVRVLAWIDG